MLRPRSVECITTEHTYCRQDIQEALIGLKNVRFFFPGSAIKEKEKELAEKFPDLVTVKIERSPLLTMNATIALAQPLMTITLNGETVLVRENGYLSPSAPIEGALPIELTATTSAQQLIAPWGKDEQKNLALLTESLVHLRPRIRKLVAEQPTKVVAFPEGNGPILLRVDAQADIPKQLSTLQAFFRSTTMESPYQELDVRFSNLVVKE